MGDNTRGEWMRRYEDEYRNHLSTTGEFNRLKVNMEDLK